MSKIMTEEDKKKNNYHASKCYVALEQVNEFPFFIPVRGCGWKEADGQDRFFADKFILGGDCFDDDVHHYGEVSRIEEHGE